MEHPTDTISLLTAEELPVVWARIWECWLSTCFLLLCCLFCLLVGRLVWRFCLVGCLVVFWFVCWVFFVGLLFAGCLVVWLLSWLVCLVGNISLSAIIDIDQGGTIPLSLSHPHRDFSGTHLSGLTSVQPGSFQNGGHVITLYVDIPPHFCMHTVTSSHHGERSVERESPGSANVYRLSNIAT